MHQKQLNVFCALSRAANGRHSRFIVIVAGISMGRSWDFTYISTGKKSGEYFMQIRDTLIKEAKIVPEIIDSIWNGITDDEINLNQKLILRIITAYSITFTTSVSPFVATCIAALGLKRLGLGAYYAGSSLYSLFSPATLKNEVLEYDSVKHDTSATP